METTAKQVEETSVVADGQVEISPIVISPVISTKKVTKEMAVEAQGPPAPVVAPAGDVVVDEAKSDGNKDIDQGVSISQDGEKVEPKENDSVVANQSTENGSTQTESNPVKPPEEKIDTSTNKSENKSVQTSTETVSGKKSKKKDTTSEEKKLVDLLVHVFDGLDTPEKKMEALAKKYIQLAADMKTSETKLDDVESKHKELKREKEQMQTEYGRVNMAKSKLESLCRELQKQNKIIKEEIQRRADEEDRKRRELSQKFQVTINDITTQMGENHKRNQQLKQDNIDLAQKLKGLVEQYEVREQHIEKVLKAKQLELQLCEAKLQQQSLISQEERQNNLREKHSLLQESLDQKKRVEMLVRQEAELKSQLALYTEKFVEFQSTLTKSNEVFATFKKEMDKMTKTIRKLEKESNMWRTRYENTNVSLIQMVEERTQNNNEIHAQKGKVDKLEKLCRALQSERRKLKKELEVFEKDRTDEVTAAEPASGSDQPGSTGKEEVLLVEGKPSPSLSPSPLENGADGSHEGRSETTEANHEKVVVNDEDKTSAQTNNESSNDE